jgi:hypothetical protein
MDWIHILAEQSRYAELRRDAERHRLIRAAYSTHQDRRYRRGLAWMGRRMAVWGTRLEKRYSSSPPLSTLQPVEEAR